VAFSRAEFESNEADFVETGARPRAAGRCIGIEGPTIA
jgi:hypothetical protein